MTSPAARFAALYAALTAAHEVERFTERIDVRGEDDCWPWRAGVFDQGYGRFKSSGKEHRAHRLAYQLAIGPIDDGAHLDHTCHNADENCPGGRTCPHRRCCNPRHLEPTTRVENVMRGRSQAAENARKTHCQKGHALTPENVRLTSDGRRRCMACAGLTGEGVGAREREKTHCPQGHPYDEENTYLRRNSDGSVKCRTCRACGREQARARRAATGRASAAGGR